MRNRFTSSTVSGGWDFLSIMIFFICLIVQWVYADVTFHGPDQIRDLDIAANIAVGRSWPLLGPPVFNLQYHLPPLFHYLVALPLVVRGDEVDVFRFFGLCLVLALVWLWWEIRTGWGHIPALLCVGLAVPVFTSIYAHSGWNPALTLTMSMCAAASWCRVQRCGGCAWTALCVSYAGLLQIHPSGLPLLPGLLLWTWMQPDRGMNRYTGMGVVCVGLMLLPWIWGLIQTSVNEPITANAVSGIGTEFGWRIWMSRWTEGFRWWDAAVMQLHMWQAVSPDLPVIGKWSVILGSLVLWVGVLLVGSTSHSWGHARPLVIIVGTWWLAALALLGQGAFWHLDAVHPWMVVLSVIGWSALALRGGRVRRWCLTIGAMLVVMASLLTQIALHTAYAERGRLDFRLSGLFFPRLDKAIEEELPAVSFRTQQALSRWQDQTNACNERWHGIHAMLLHDLTNRSRLRSCGSTQIDATGGSDFLLTFSTLDVNFQWTDGLELASSGAGYRVLRHEQLPVFINGEQRSQVFGSQRLNYMLFHPQEWSDPIEITILGSSKGALIRVGMRCNVGSGVGRLQAWRMLPRADAWSLSMVRTYRWLGHEYVDLEWRIAKNDTDMPLMLRTVAPNLHCDIDVAARKAVNFSIAKLSGGTNRTISANPIE